MKKIELSLCIAVAIDIIAVFIALGYLLFYANKSTNTNLYIYMICGLMAFSSLFVGLGIYFYKCMHFIPSEEKVEGWITNAVSKDVPIKIDKQVITKIEELKSMIHADLCKVYSSSNSNLIFLQNLANAIGDKGSAWDEKQIARFMACLNVITGMQNKKVKLSDVDSLKVEKSANKSDGTSDSQKDVK